MAGKLMEKVVHEQVVIGSLVSTNIRRTALESITL
jgi:hypothetical protein